MRDRLELALGVLEQRRLGGGQRRHRRSAGEQPSGLEVVVAVVGPARVGDQRAVLGRVVAGQRLGRPGGASGELLAPAREQPARLQIVLAVGADLLERGDRPLEVAGVVQGGDLR